MKTPLSARFPGFQTVLMLLAMAQSNEARWKRMSSSGDANSTFHINVSAGYGVQSDNGTADRAPPRYHFQERKVKGEEPKQDQLATADQIQSYQVVEPNSEPIQDKSYSLGGNRYQQYQPFVHARARPSLKELQNVVNNVEFDEPISHGGKNAPSKIVEVVRVPAIYELHLQSDNHDAQRFVTLNPWLTRLNGFVPQKPKPQHQFGAAQFGRFGNQQHSYQLHLPRPAEIQHQYSQGGYEFGLSQQPKTILQPRPVYKTVQRHHHHVPDSFKLSQDVQSQNHWVQDAAMDYYKKPQAIHEVPAPVLNRQPPISLPKIKTTSLPTMVYGQNVDTVSAPMVYKTPRPFSAIPQIWVNKQQQSQVDYPIQLKPVTSQYEESAFKTQDYPGLYQQYVEEEPSITLNPIAASYEQIGPNYVNFLPMQNQEKLVPVETNSHYVKQDLYGINEGIGDYLDQNLVNINYVSHNGDVGNQAAATEAAKNKEEDHQDDNAQFQSDMKANKPEEIFSQNIAPDVNLLLVKTPHQQPSAEEEGYRFESMKLHQREEQRAPPRKVNFPRPFRSSNRRIAPMDYIIYIKERTFE